MTNSIEVEQIAFEEDARKQPWFREKMLTPGLQGPYESALMGARFQGWLARAQADRGEVTDAMRDAALKCWMGNSIIVPFAGESRMRAAIKAALIAKSEGV